MKFSYHFILLFIYFSTVFGNPHASPSYTIGSSRIRQVSSPLLDCTKIPQKPNVTVSQDGKGDFKKIMDAIAAAPSHSTKYFVILVKKGVYKEYVNIDNTKSNMVLIGEGKDATIISGSRSVGRGQATSFDTATFAVMAQGFVAMNIGFENTAGQKNMQAVALLSNGDRSVFYKCKIKGNQDTLLVQAGRQFFRECQIIGTVDFIFGYGTAVFQKCNIYIKQNQINGTNVIAAHGRNSSTDSAGFSFQQCIINGDPQFSRDSTHVGAYLGRSWGIYARTVFLQSSISSVLSPEGWLQWHKDPVDKLYFGEYQNSGPGAALGGRVKWPGFHKMSTSDADKFTVANFVDGNSWLASLGIPYSQGLEPEADLPMMEA